MSRLERKEYQETKIMRRVSPVRTMRGGSAQNLSEFDHNLDNLLEDLQTSVSRPGSSLGNVTHSGTYKDSSRISSYDNQRSSSLTRVSKVRGGPGTEYSSDDSYSYTSPDGTKSYKTYKKESYSYQTNKDQVPKENIRAQNNINQLDSLLDDLQQVKPSSGKRILF